MAVPQFSTTPNSITSPDTFDTDSDAYHAELAAFINALNALGITGGVMAIPYTFSTTTADADPGAGLLRLNHATQNLATVVRADLLSNAGSDWTTVLDTFDDSTSTIKGQLGLVDLNDGTKFLIFNVTAVATPSGYRNITVAAIGGSAASPFANGASLLMTFTRTGDKGETGATGPAGTNGTNGADPGMVLLATASASSSAAIDFTSQINSTYDEYLLVFINAVPSTDLAAFNVRGSKDAGATWLSTAEYSFTNSFVYSTAAAASSSTDGTNRINVTGNINVRSAGGGGLVGISGHVRLIRPSASRYCALRFESNYDVSNGTLASGLVVGAGRIDAGSGLTINAIRFLFNSGNIASGEFKLYGLKKAV